MQRGLRQKLQGAPRLASGDSCKNKRERERESKESQFERNKEMRELERDEYLLVCLGMEVWVGIYR